MGEVGYLDRHRSIPLVYAREAAGAVDPRLFQLRVDENTVVEAIAHAVILRQWHEPVVFTRPFGPFRRVGDRQALLETGVGDPAFANQRVHRLATGESGNR